MACPDFQTFTLPILQAAAGGQARPLSELREEAATLLKLSEADMAETIPSGRQLRFHNRSNWACMYLTAAGLLEKVSRAIYRITAQGKQVLASPPERISVAFLLKFPEFKQWRSKSTDDEEIAAATTSNDQASTPEEMIEAGYTALRDTVEAELIKRILAASPAFFENLVVDLLVAMGYGGTRADAGSALGKSGDGGIDGIIKEDRLGLDAVYIQAKRWDPEKHKVSRPDVQGFAGSLEGFRARKGVFITTTTFSKEAHDFVSRIEKRIVLIDGPRLAALLFDHGVGVRTKEAYEVKEVDEDTFTDA